MEIFKGIKFASADRLGHPIPLGDLKSIEDIDCKETICPQPESGLVNFYGTQTEYIKQSEDCLCLSIYTPGLNVLRPVLIWIHGGAYITGGGQYVRYDSSDFAESEGIVVVSISYRLGMLGHFNGMNLALEDQICAMEWVYRNIHLFGGNNKKITVMGQSAGAHSLLCHISQLKKPLFSKAIIMSAPFIEKSKKSMEKITRKFLNALPVNVDNASIEQILSAQEIATKTIIPSMPISPVCHNLTCPRNIVPGLEKVIIMYHKDDAAPFSPYRVLTGFMTKIVFGIPSEKFAKHLRKVGIDVKVVVRTWGHFTARFGAIHFMEIPLLMGDWRLWKKGPFLDGISDNEYEDEARKFRKYIGDFVKS